MALIEMHPDLRRTNDLLARIAVALERICTIGYGVPLTDPDAVEEPKKLGDEMTYTDDLAIIRREFEDAAGIPPPEDENVSPEDR